MKFRTSISRIISILSIPTEMKETDTMFSISYYLPMKDHMDSIVKYFNKQIPETGSINLYDDSLTSEKLLARLLLPLERCKYCSDECIDIPWRQISNPSTLDDWIVS